MVNQQLIEFIQKSRATGHSDEQIKTVLLENGWQGMDIIEGFKAIPPIIQPFHDTPSTLFSQVNQNSGKKIAIIVSVIVFLVLSVGGVFVYYQLSYKKVAGQAIEDTDQLNQHETTTTEEKYKDANDSITDCGSIGPENPSDAGKVSNCINPKFMECAPAKVVFSLDMSALGAGIVTYAYEIIGPDGNMCKMKSKFLKNPNVTLLDKEMTCSYDNTKSFEDATGEPPTVENKCSGPLYDAMPKSS